MENLLINVYKYREIVTTPIVKNYFITSESLHMP